VLAVELELELELKLELMKWRIEASDETQIPQH
jgi:hypothetical protein